MFGTRRLAMALSTALALTGLAAAGPASTTPAPATPTASTAPLASTTTTPSTPASTAACEAQPPAEVAAPSPITGWFVFYDSDPCVALDSMQRLAEVGADTAVTFGFRLNKVAGVDDQGRVLTSAGELDPKWADCVDGGVSCVAAAQQAVSDSTIRRVMYHSSPEHLGPDVLTCTANGRDAEVVHDNHRYQRVLLPVGDDQGCTAEHSSYDVVLIDNGAVGVPDSVESTLAAADAYGIDFWMGMPVPGKNPASPWLPDVTELDTLGAFSSRLFADWQTRHADHESFVGVYQSTEMPMKDNDAWQDVYDTYTVQHQLAAEHLPGKGILISPYQDARPSAGVPVEMSAGAFTKMVGTAPEGTKVVVAPQDGRGTSKVGVFFPDQVHDKVEQQLWSVIDRNLTYGEAYVGVTGDYYASSAAGRDQQANPDAELWYNLEVMARGVGEGQHACGAHAAPSIAATWDRVAQQLTVAGNHASKVIGYMYDDLLECDQPGVPDLRAEMIDADGQPIPNSATWESRDGVEGLLITGYGLRDTSAVVRWLDPSGQEQVRTVGARDQRWRSVGRGSAAVPSAVQEVWLPLEGVEPATDTPWLRIEMENAAGAIPYGEYVVVPAS